MYIPYICIYTLLYTYIYIQYIYIHICIIYTLYIYTLYIHTMRIECKLRTIVQYHIIQHSKIHGQRVRQSPFCSRPTAAPE